MAEGVCVMVTGKAEVYFAVIAVTNNTANPA
jgi:hypothetical protein